MIILMADIVGSSRRKGDGLMKDFKKAVEFVNRKHEKSILSPLTITLGDEFQGVIRSLQAAIQIIFDMEVHVMGLKSPFKLRFVIQEGEIQTKLNRVNAHEMLGPGLTDARNNLLAAKTSRKRYLTFLDNKELAESLNLLFVVMQGIADRWTRSQQAMVAVFLELDDYRKVAKRVRKDPSSVWRRKRSTLIEEYNSLKKVMLKISQSA